MSTYTDASLIMYPSGYKEDKIYSLKPTDGSGDLTFTRASTATRVNSDGLIETSPVNLLEQSNTFNTTWIAVNSGSVVSGQSGYDGSSNAWTLTKIATSYSGIKQNIIYSDTSTFAIYAKANTLNYLWVEEYPTGGNIWFDLINGTTSGSGFLSSSMTSVGNGWWKCLMTASGNRTVLNFYPQATSGVTSTAGSIYIQDAQLNIGATAKPYFPTTDRLNVPRIDYTGGGCGSLLLEPQRTNLVTYSEQFDNADWSKLGQGIADTAVVTANYAISPDGTQNATRFVCNLNGGTTSNDRSWMIASFTAQATSTISIWIKLNSAGTKTFVFSDAGGGTKTISGTDWQRIDETFLSPGGEFRIGLIGGTGSSDTLDCCIWGAQAEAGSYPTSYIKSEGAATTRLADSASKTGISSLINSVEGVLYINTSTPINDATAGVISVSDGTLSNRCILFYGVGNISARLTVGGVNSIVLSKTFVTSDYHKIAARWNATTFDLYVDGVFVSSTANSSFSANTLTSLQFDAGSGANNFLGNAQSVQVLSYLTDTQMVSLTTL